jgi:hypothetical protein
MAERLTGGIVLIGAALAFGSTNAEAGYCLDSLAHTTLQTASYNNAGDCIAFGRSSGLLSAPNHQPAAGATPPAPGVAESLRVSLSAPLIPAPSRAEDVSAISSNGPLVYSILEQKDDHVLGGVRVIVRIQLSRKASESELRHIGEEIICQETVSRRLNAIQLLYYLADADISGLSVVGTALWAPSGHWDAAHTVRLGDYTRHQHVVPGGRSEGTRECRTTPERPQTTP